ncbi:MAG TPA: hydroxysqualene dehydroxylase HpnE [Candidatus Kapabacteria bacterium]|nr:hydroxysqualene dehydroxylase HpnE [Candidatus Kapabacteria bacterium]
MSELPRVAIIGTGISGLAAAVRLTRDGIKNVTIFEARREPGGRTRSYIDPKTGDELDNGQHLLMGCYTATLDYLSIIRSERMIERIPLRIPFWSNTGVRSFTIDRSLAPPLNLLIALARTSLLTFSEKRAAAKLGNAIWRSKLPNDFQRMTCEDFFGYFEQPDSLVLKLWSPIVLATINAAPARASAELFVNVLREAFFSSRSASALLIPKCGLSELLVQPAIHFLEEQGGKIQVGSPIRSVEKFGNIFKLSLDSETLEFDAVIDASSQFNVGPEAPPIPNVEYSPIVNAYFWLDRSVFKAPVHAFVGTTLQWAFPKQSHYCAERVALTVSAAEGLVDKSNESIRDILWADLQQTVPAARDATLLHWQIIREKHATPLFTPELQQSRPNTKTTMNNFYRTGDLIQNGLPATIEGAVRNGYTAAEALLETPGNARIFSESIQPQMGRGSD